MTDQEAFSKVYNHMMTQKQETEYYRDYNLGIRCAVGAIIPDAEYKESFEGLGVAVVQMRCPTLQTLSTRLLLHLQMINDIVPPARWGAALEECATFFRLSVPGTAVKKAPKIVAVIRELAHAGA